jgi:hypothetical protein
MIIMKYQMTLFHRKNGSNGNIAGQRTKGSEIETQIKRPEEHDTNKTIFRPWKPLKNEFFLQIFK